MTSTTVSNETNSLKIEMSVQECMDKNTRPEIPFEDYLGIIEQLEIEHSDIANNTKLMFTKIRMIYYNNFGWNDELIRGTEKVVPFKNTPAGLATKDHIVKLQNGDLYDIAHIFAIVDAGNHDGYFTPLPNFLMFLHRFFPTVKSRLTASGWLGDLSSVTGQFFLTWKTTKNQLTPSEKQLIVNEYSPCDKMISNADALLIINNYKVSSSKGKKVSEILRDYFDVGGKGVELRKKRILLFSQYLGLEDWNGGNFSNEENWLNYYQKQLTTCSSFYLFFFREKLSTIIWSIFIWLGFYKKEVAVNEVLNSFMVGLKSALKNNES